MRSSSSRDPAIAGAAVGVLAGAFFGLFIGLLVVAVAAYLTFGIE